MRAALLQLNVSDQPNDNLKQVLAWVDEAAAAGARMVFTPEVSNCLSTSRTLQQKILHEQENDPMLNALRALAKTRAIYISIGSLAVKTNDPDGRFANRSFIIDPKGEIIAQYDKIHMFDVKINAQETYMESEGFRPGTQAVVVDTLLGKLGLCICYDLRFPLLAHALAQAGAQILQYPAAFSPVTGKAHWHSLLRARAIETGCFVIAAAQTGKHPTSGPKARETFGHSLVVDPWGKVILDAQEHPGVYHFDIDLQTMKTIRNQVPALANTRSFQPPN